MLMERGDWDTGSAGRTVAGDARCLHLRAGPGRVQSADRVIRYFPESARAEGGRGMSTPPPGYRAEPARRRARCQAHSNSTASRSRRSRARQSGRWRAASAPHIPHLCHRPEPGYRPDGNCRACMVEIEGERVLAASCKRAPAVGMKVQDRDGARDQGAGHGDGAAGRRPAGARNVARSDVRTSGAGRNASASPKAASRPRERWAARSEPSGDAGQPRCLHPVQSVRPRLPRGAGERRDRHGVSQRECQDRVRFRRPDGRSPPASPAANACRPARPAR